LAPEELDELAQAAELGHGTLPVFEEQPGQDVAVEQENSSSPEPEICAKCAELVASDWAFCENCGLEILRDQGNDEHLPEVQSQEEPAELDEIGQLGGIAATKSLEAVDEPQLATPELSCTECNSRVESSWVYCEECGHQLGVDVSVPVPVPEPESVPVPEPEPESVPVPVPEPSVSAVGASEESQEQKVNKVPFESTAANNDVAPGPKVRRKIIVASVTSAAAVVLVGSIMVTASVAPQGLEETATELGTSINVGQPVAEEQDGGNPEDDLGSTTEPEPEPEPVPEAEESASAEQDEAVPTPTQNVQAAVKRPTTAYLPPGFDSFPGEFFRIANGGFSLQNGYPINTASSFRMDMDIGKHPDGIGFCEPGSAPSLGSQAAFFSGVAGTPGLATCSNPRGTVFVFITDMQWLKKKIPQPVVYMREMSWIFGRPISSLGLDAGDPYLNQNGWAVAVLENVGTPIFAADPLVLGDLWPVAIALPNWVIITQGPVFQRGMVSCPGFPQQSCASTLYVDRSAPE
jgi:hypothetical protein